MSLKLVKTVGGTHGAPEKCSACGGQHFVQTGIAWHCAACKIYIPADLKTSIEKFEALQRYHKQNRWLIDALENQVVVVK